MESWQQKHVRKNFPYLIENTLCNKGLLSRLISSKIISEEDKQEIESKATEVAKADKLYTLLLSRTGSYNALLEALASMKQTGAHRVLNQRLGATLLKTCNIVEYDKNYVLGKGGNSCVYKGTMGPRDVAVKRLKDTSQGVTKLLNEVNILKDLPTHSNIVQFFATYEEPKHLLIALELCDRSLEDCVKENAFPLDKHDILRQATEGLAFLHANNIIHRDLKPTNILLTKHSKDSYMVKVSDFGLSKVIEKHRETVTASSRHVPGTLNWMSPEALRYAYEEFPTEKFKWKKSSDIFSLGCIYCYIATEGRHPFGSGLQFFTNILNGLYFLPVLSGGLRNRFRPLIGKMIRIDPTRRPTCEQVLSEECFVQLSCTRISSSSVAPDLPSSNPRSSSPMGFNFDFGDLGTLLLKDITRETPEDRILRSIDHRNDGHNLIGMKVLERFYVSTISRDITPIVQNKEQIIDVIETENIISIRQADILRRVYKSWYNVGEGRRTLHVKTFPYSLFEILSKMPDSYRILTHVMYTTGNIQLFNKLRDGQKILQEFQLNKIFYQTSYAIAMQYDAEKALSGLGALSPIELSKIRGKKGENLLHIAVGCGNVPIIHKLYLMEIETLCEDEDGLLPHHYLGRWSSNVSEVTKSLLEIGVDISRKRSSKSLLCFLAENNSSPDHFHDWIQLIFSVNMEKVLIENWCLGYVLGCFEILEKTLALMKGKGFPLNQRYGNGRGLVQYAVQDGATKKTFEALIKYGVDWNYSDTSGRTVLHYAVKRGNIEAVEYFVNLGANVNAKDGTGRTPLQYLKFAYVNHVEMTKLLVSKGAKVTALDNSGNTPAHDTRGCWARKVGEYREWTEYILENGLVTKSYFRQKNKLGKLPLPPC